MVDFTNLRTPRILDSNPHGLISSVWIWYALLPYCCFKHSRAFDQQKPSTNISLIKGHVRLLIFRKSSPAVIKAYPSITFRKKFQPTCLLEAYLPIEFFSYLYIPLKKRFNLKLKTVKWMKWMNEITCCKCARLEEVIKEACPYRFKFSPTLLLDRHSVLPVYYT